MNQKRNHKEKAQRKFCLLRHGLAIPFTFSIFCDFSFQLKKHRPFKCKRTSETYLEPRRTSAIIKALSIFISLFYIYFFHILLSYTL